MKRKYIKVLSVILVFAVSAVVFCFSASARQVEGAQVGGNGVVSGNPIYDNNDGYVFNEKTYLLNANNFSLSLNGYSMSHAINQTNNPLFSESSPFYITAYDYGGYYGTLPSYPMFNFTASDGLGMLKGSAGYEQRYTLAFASNFKFPSLFGPLLPGQVRLQCNIYYMSYETDSTGSAINTKYGYKTLNFTEGEIYGIECTTEGFFTGSISLDTEFAITSIGIIATVDATNEEVFDDGFGFFFIGNLIAEDVAPTYADSPDYRPPDNSGYNDSVDVENDFNSVLNDSANEFDDIIIDTENLIIADGLYGEFALVKDFLGRIFAIDIIYKLSMVAICFGLLTFLINLGVKLISGRRKDGD